MPRGSRYFCPLTNAWNQFANQKRGQESPTPTNWSSATVRPISSLPETVWHVAAASGVPIYNNVYLAEGLLHSVSLVNQMPGLDGVVSWQSLKGMNDRKEIVWDRVRKQLNDQLPTRNGALFVVDSEARAREISEKWFPNQARNILPAQIVKGSTKFATDDKLA